MKYRREINFDDSSDEDSVKEAAKKYSLEKSLKKFCETSKIDESSDDEKLPFIAHAFGIGLLYCEDAGRSYYGEDDEGGLKAKYLSSIITPEVLKGLIDKALLRTLLMFYDEVDDAKFQEVKKALKIGDVLDAVIQDVSDNYGIYVDETTGLLKIVDGDGEEFFNLAAEAIDDAIVDAISKDDLKGEPDSHFASFYNRAIKAAIPYLEKTGIIVGNATISSRRSDPHRIGDKKAEFSAEDKTKSDFPKNTCEKITSSLGAKNLFESSLVGKEDEIASAFFDDCVINHNVFVSQIRQNLCDLFLVEVRKDLPDAFLTEEISSPALLFANLRLSNRSATRKMKRLDLTSQISADVFEEFFGIKQPSSDSRIWNISGVPVREGQTVDDSYSRVDMVFESDASKGGKYPALCEKLDKFCKDKKIDNAAFAKLVKCNLGVKEYKDDESLKELLQDKALKQFVAKLSYLLFGCEVVRNPASLIMHQMMLDLIENGQKNWSDFFGESKKEVGKKAVVSKQMMPMAPEGAVSKARHLHSVFAEYMPWSYKYEGVEEESSELEEAEKDLFSEWLKYKDIDPQFASEAILVGCNKWYGVDAVDVIYADDENQIEIFLRNLIKKDPKDIRFGEYALVNNLLKTYYVDLDDKMLEEIRDKKDSLLSAILLSNAEKEKGVGYTIDQVLDNEDDLLLEDLKEKFSQFLIEKIESEDGGDFEDEMIDLLDVCDLNFCDDQSNSLLLWAAAKECRKLFNIMIKECDIEELMGSFGSDNDTPIMYAMKNGWIEEVEKLSDHIDLDTIDEKHDEKTILYLAIEALEQSEGDDKYNRWVEVIIKILDKGANPNLTYEDEGNVEYNCLTYAIEKLWKDDSIEDDLSESDERLCEALYKAALRINKGKDETEIKDNDFYEGDNQAYFDKWEAEIKKEFNPKSSAKPQSGQLVSSKSQGKLKK